MPTPKTISKEDVQKEIDGYFHKWFHLAKPFVCQSNEGTGIDMFAPLNTRSSDYRLDLGIKGKQAMGGLGIAGYTVASLSIRGTDDQGNQARFTCDTGELINQSLKKHRGKWWTVGVLTLNEESEAEEAAEAMLDSKFAAIRLHELSEMPGAKECAKQYKALTEATARIGGHNIHNRVGPILYYPKKMVLLWEPSGAPTSDGTCWHNQNVRRERELLAGSPQGLSAVELDGPIGQA